MHIACLAGISPWKRQRIRQFLGDGRNLPIARNAEEAIRIAIASNGAIACWASRAPKGLVERAKAKGVEIWWIEDGFIRSVGLGVDLHLPASIVLDCTGMHYDPTRRSDLETILQNSDFSDEFLTRATQLIEQINRNRLTKYNLGGGPVDLPSDRKCILILGQVADDQSVMLGGGKSFAEIADCVRRAKPNSFVIYKPHPDVVAGVRQGERGVDADLIAPDADLTSLFDMVDEIHVLSSLGGFEALLRGCAVHVHGAPFYAGWGLTHDHQTFTRRNRKLTLEQLVTGALIRYPRYCHPQTGARIEVEELVQFLSSARHMKRITSPLRRLSAKAAIALAR